MNSASFWQNQAGFSSANSWNLSLVASGYLPFVSTLSARVPYYCLSEIVADPKVGSITPLGFIDSQILPLRDSTTTSAHIYSAETITSLVGFALQSNADASYAFELDTFRVVSKTTGSTTYWLPGIYYESREPHTYVLVSIPNPPPPPDPPTPPDPAASFEASLTRNADGEVVLKWSSTNAKSLTFTGTLTNKAGDSGSANSPAVQISLSGTGAAGTKTLGEYTYGQYSGSLSANLTTPSGTKSRIIVNLALTSTLPTFKPISQVSFPDVFTGKAKTITYKDDKGKLKKTSVSAVSAERMDSIKWLASSEVTLGSQTDQSGNVTYRPQDTVNRGAMAQFLQKLAGFTDAQIAQRYDKVSAPYSDLGGLSEERRNAIVWMWDSGIAAAASAYNPANPVNRGAMAEFMRKFADVEETTATKSDFPDVTTGGVTLTYLGDKKATKVGGLNTARIGAINWVRGTGITSGSGSSNDKVTYKPQAPVNRGAMAQFMHKLALLLGSTTYPAK
jgi:hypothetical protein